MTQTQKPMYADTPAPNPLIEDFLAEVGLPAERDWLVRQYLRAIALMEDGNKESYAWDETMYEARRAVEEYRPGDPVVREAFDILDEYAYRSENDWTYEERMMDLSRPALRDYFEPEGD